MKDDEIIRWLLEGDVSIQYQIYRDLLDSEQNLLRQRIEAEGWGAGFLSRRLENGHWGGAFYQPKWTSTHYTLLGLKNLSISPDNLGIKQTLYLIFKNEKGQDGGILVANNSHGDASMASVDPESEFVGVIIYIVFII